MECNSLKEVRENIDRIDCQIIKLIGERGAYVAQASKFKQNTNEVRAPKRLEAVIDRVRTLADQYGANPDMIEKLYREMIAQFITMEMDEFKNNK